MKIYSNTLTRKDLFATLPMGVSIVTCDELKRTRSKTDEILGVRTRDQDGRRYAYGWNVYLEGSSMHRSQHDRDSQAATWDEWGIWMAELYRLDPEVKVGWYESYNHFIEVTRRTRKHYEFQTSQIAREHRAPWLDVTDSSFPLTADEAHAMFAAKDAVK